MKKIIWAIPVAIVLIVGLLMVPNPLLPAKSGIYTQLSFTRTDGSVTTYDPAITPIAQSVATGASVSSLKVCSWLATPSAYGSYLLSLTQTSGSTSNSSGLRAVAPNSVAKSTCVSVPAPTSGTVTFNGKGFIAGLGTSSSVFQQFSQRQVSVSMSGGQIASAKVAGIGNANSTTLICQSNCRTFTTSSTSTLSGSTTSSTTSSTTFSTSTISTVTGTTTTIDGQQALLTSDTTNLISTATSANTAVISSTSLAGMGGTSALTMPPNLICLGTDGTQQSGFAFPSPNCFVYASSSTGYFYSPGVVGYNPDGSPILAWAQLSGASFQYGSTFQTYPQLQAAMTQYGSLKNYATQVFGYCSGAAQRLGAC